MDGLFQIIDALLLHYIYGTPDRPRPMFRRFAMRAIVIGGGACTMALFLGMLPVTFWTGLIAVVWLFVTTLSIGAEFRLGQPWMSLVAVVIFV